MITYEQETGIPKTAIRKKTTELPIKAANMIQGIINHRMERKGNWGLSETKPKKHIGSSSRKVDWQGWSRTRVTENSNSNNSPSSSSQRFGAQKRREGLGDSRYLSPYRANSARIRTVSKSGSDKDLNGPNRSSGMVCVLIPGPARPGPTRATTSNFTSSSSPEDGVWSLIIPCN